MNSEPARPSTTGTFESPTVLTVATKGYFVVANNANSKTNGGVKADYAYAKLAISNSGTNLALTSGETLAGRWRRANR